MGRVLRPAVVTARTSGRAQSVATSPSTGQRDARAASGAPRSNGDSGLVTETIQRDLTRFLRYRVETLEAALCRVEELRCAAAQGDLEPCNPPIH